MTAHEATRPAVYSVAELVEVFGGRRRRAALYDDIAKGLIPSLRLGRRVFIPAWFVDQLRQGTGEQSVSSEPLTSSNRTGTRQRAKCHAAEEGGEPPGPAATGYHQASQVLGAAPQRV